MNVLDANMLSLKINKIELQIILIDVLNVIANNTHLIKKCFLKQINISLIEEEDYFIDCI